MLIHFVAKLSTSSSFITSLQNWWYDIHDIGPPQLYVTVVWLRYRPVYAVQIGIYIKLPVASMVLIRLRQRFGHMALTKQTVL